MKRERERQTDRQTDRQTERANEIGGKGDAAGYPPTWETLISHAILTLYQLLARNIETLMAEVSCQRYTLSHTSINKLLDSLFCDALI